MRKLMLSLVFVLGATTMVNANNEVEKVNIITPIAVTVEDDGCAGDCVRSSTAHIMKAVRRYNLDISRGGADYETMMEAYMAIYTDCVGDCGIE